MGQRTYAVWWQEGDSARHAGKLQLGRLHLLLSANGAGKLAVPIEDIVSVGYRGNGLDIERRGGTHVRIGNLDGIGALLELSEALSAAA